MKQWRTVTTNKAFSFSLAVETYTSPTQTQCFNVNYYIPEDEVSDKFSDDRWDRTREYWLLLFGKPPVGEQWVTASDWQAAFYLKKFFRLELANRAMNRTKELTVERTELS